MADAGRRIVPEALPVDLTVIVTLSVPTFGSLYVALPLPEEFSRMVLTVTGTSGAGPQAIRWPRRRKFSTLLDRTVNVTFPLSVGSVADPTWMYFPLDVPE